MTTWMRIDRSWPDHLGLFVLDIMRLPEIGVLFSQLKAEEDADTGADLIRMALLNEHPELKGGVLLSMTFDPYRKKLQFLYSHDSLPKCDMGQQPMQFPFMSNERR